MPSRKKQLHNGWTCFHCGEHFGNPNLAQAHFGETPASRPACVLIQERGMLYELRAAQKAVEDAELRANIAEDATECLQSQFDELKRLTGCDGVNEARCELDNLRGRVAVYDLVTDKFRERAPELYAEIIG